MWMPPYVELCIAGLCNAILSKKNKDMYIYMHEYTHAYHSRIITRAFPMSEMSEWLKHKMN